MAVLRVKAGPQKGKVLEITDASVVLGRDPGEGMALLDTSASRRHAEVFQMGEMCFVRDLESKNGTFVNDQKVDEELLKEGDRIRIGETLLVFETLPQGAPSGPAAPEFLQEEDKLATTMELHLDTTRIRRVDPAKGKREGALEVLFQVSKALAIEREPQPLLRKVLELAAPAVQAESGYLFLREGSKGDLVSQATWGPPVKVSGSIVRRAIQDSRAVLVAEALSDSRFKDQRSVVIHRIGPVLCAPLVSPGKVRGALYLSRRFGAPPFNEDDLDLVAAVGMQAGIALENAQVHERLRQSALQMVRGLVAISEMRSPETRKGHAERVAAYSLAIARELGLPDDEGHRVQLAALLHDIGKISASGEARSDAEHVLTGERLLERVPALAEFSAGARFHHERMDGSGFPRGLKGDEIPLAGRIVMLANWYDNLTTDGGVGHQGLAPKEVLKELQVMAGTRFDAKVARALLTAYRNARLYAPEVLYDEGWSEAV